MSKTMSTSSDQARAHDVYRYKHNPLDSIFAPKSVAVIGATEREGSTGRTIVWNLMQNSFGGVIYPVNPKRHSILGIKAYPSIGDIPDDVDLAVIVTPAPTVPGIVQECVDKGVKGAIIISAGFKETGLEGIELERQVMEAARKGQMRIIGPNCLGVMNPMTGLNATFASRMAMPGSVGFISQSGALCTAVLDWSMRENVGFSAFVSIGSMLDVDWGDLIHYLGDDPKTKSIVIYMETIGNARSFISAAREVALTKPIIVIKPGRTEAAAKAAASHTGSLTGSDEVLRAAFRRCGVLRVDTIDGLFSMAEVLAKQPRPTGPRLTIVTNAGGPGVLATDALITGGGELAELSPETMAELNELLPGPWSHNNPIDILGDADEERYTKALEIAAKDPNSDGLMVILTPQAMTAPTQTAQALKKMYKREDGRPFGKPLLASWMGGADISAGESILNQSGIPTYAYPDTAASVFNYMWRYTQRLHSLYETPVLPAYSEEDTIKHQQIREMLHKIGSSGRTILTEYESKLILAAYGIHTVETRLAQSADEAVAIAEEIGYPVVLKLNSETITHKTDVGGVRLDLAQENEVRHAYQSMERRVTEKFGPEHFLGVTVQPMLNLKDGYELIIGSSPDPQFGPVLLFGTGGTLVEVFKDRALGLPPLTTTLARRMIEETKIYNALRGVRGRDPVDLAALEELMVRFSQLVVEQRWIKEIDINPLFASSEEIIALDARVVLYEPTVPKEDLPQLAIRPYPARYIKPYTAKDGSEFIIRPIRPEDEPMIVNYHRTLSEQSVYMRYFRAFQYNQRVEHDRMIRICFVDYDRDIALVTERTNPHSGEKEIVAVGRLSKIHGTGDAEFAMLVNDACQGKGIGTELLERLLEIGRYEKVERIFAYMLAENRGMYHICQGLGFSFEREESLIKAEISL
ncbi:MAG: bifunctional acetate--CoA ligase family protein/GNAT family N-acetyltransferase [Ardenticatenaceae bacterium]|nr:bifunctional acetate--CoA ligase family protein/GNAT family N-acetyltransferase [Anaerolineales bacterium]MCB8923821.1 bifunctional acetate--CoA ligase family protein/GNAT family N-acetyltransferase [Ardenticatenaceae bacterium]MCB9003400.1 bifunctional acetate--CoA ligase family protein/GNAT family N-acetyltransferase [Ardenticatenaceae bacterium]